MKSADELFSEFTALLRSVRSEIDRAEELLEIPIAVRLTRRECRLCRDHLQIDWLRGKHVYTPMPEPRPGKIDTLYGVPVIVVEETPTSRVDTARRP